MMRKQIAAVILAASVVGGVGAGILANALTTNEPAAAAGSDKNPTDGPATPTDGPTTSVTDGPDDAPTSPADLVVKPGAVGPIAVGTSKVDAVDSGLLTDQTVSPVEGCPAPELEWAAAFKDVLDVHTLGNGEVASIGIWKQGPKTAAGLGIGSTYADVQAAVPDAVAVEAGYGQAGVYEFDGDTGGWIGYLFDATEDSIKPTDTVTFMEVTKGGQPGLMRDGC